MSGIEDLIAQYQKSAGLSRDARTRLESGEPMESLDVLFAEKKALEASLTAIAAQLKAADPLQVQAALLAQSQAVREEAALVETLAQQAQKAKIVSQVTKAYQAPGLDKSGPGRFNIDR
jgi:hypothetical protein